MNLPDVNILIQALMPQGPFHEICAGWLAAEMRGNARFAVTSLTGSALVRISTSKKVYSPPATLEEAIAFFDTLTSHPDCVMVEPGPSHWAIFKSLCRATSASGNLVSDAWLAAIAIEHDCTFITLDRDLRRFPGLRTAPPLIGP